MPDIFTEGADPLGLNRGDECLEEAAGRPPNQSSQGTQSRATDDIRSGARKVLRRKSSSGVPDIVPIAPAAHDPTAEGQQVAADWRDGAEAIIRGSLRIKSAIDSFGEEIRFIEAFVAALVHGRVLPANEQELGRSGPKLSKLIRIGEHADVLRSREVLPFLGTSYTTIYQLVVLYEVLPNEDEEQRVKQLVEILGRCPGAPTREYLSEQTNRVKRERGLTKKRSAARPDGKAPAEERRTQSLEPGVAYDLLLLTPRDEDLARLRQDYADEGTLERCLPWFQRLDDDAAVVIVTTITALPVVVERLMPLCGFRRVSRVFLARRPMSPDVTDAEIIVTAERGEMRRSSSDSVWPDNEEAFEPFAVASRFYPEASRRLHVFAAAAVDRWHCLVGDNSWAEEPSL